jgi:hypothetical protein
MADIKSQKIDKGRSVLNAADEAANPQAGDRHLIDLLIFGGSDGLMDGDVLGEHGLVFLGGFALQD